MENSGSLVHSSGNFTNTFVSGSRMTFRFWDTSEKNNLPITLNMKEILSNFCCTETFKNMLFSYNDEANSVPWWKLLPLSTFGHHYHHLKNYIHNLNEDYLTVGQSKSSCGTAMFNRCYLAE
jgi:hypothetical protein